MEGASPAAGAQGGAGDDVHADEQSGMMIVATSVSLVPAEVKCSTCDQMVLKSECVVVARASSKSSQVDRCKRCHAARARLDRLLKHHQHANLVSDWRSMSEDERRAFIAESNHLAGADLIAKLSETVTLTKTSTSKTSFSSSGQFKDEAQLEQDYAGRPEIVQNIKANARKILCPVKKIYLYEDVTYSSNRQDEESKTEKHVVNVDFSPDAGPSAPARAPARALAAEAAPAAPGSAPAKKGKARAGEGKPAPKKKPRTSAAAMKDAQRVIGVLAPHKHRLQKMLQQVETRDLITLVPQYVVNSSRDIYKQLEKRYEIAERLLGGDACEDRRPIRYQSFHVGV